MNNKLNTTKSIGLCKEKSGLHALRVFHQYGETAPCQDQHLTLLPFCIIPILSLPESDKESYSDLVEKEPIILTRSPRPTQPFKSLHPSELPLLSVGLLSSCHHLFFFPTPQPWLMLVLFCPRPHLLLSLIISLVFTHLSIFFRTHKSEQGTSRHSLSDCPEGCIRMCNASAREHWSNTWQLLDASVIHTNPQPHVFRSLTSTVLRQRLHVVGRKAPTYSARKQKPTHTGKSCETPLHVLPGVWGGGA